MMPAAWPLDDPRTTRLLHLDPERGALVDRTIGDLRALLRKHDLLVVNDAATLPASLHGVTESGALIEARLAGERGDGSWRAVLMGAGDWRQRTEERPPPPAVGAGEVLRFAGLRATVTSVDEASPRLVSLVFDAHEGALWRALYRAGRPVQYAHTAAPLALWQVQTAYAARPWAAEAPSAGFALTWDLLLDLRRRGVGIGRVTHAAGLSSTGDGELDGRLPLAERYEVTADTVRAIESARERGGRVVAVGTTAARALEGAAANDEGRLVARQGMTELLLGPHARRNVVDGIVTGVHDPGTSHFALLEAFAPRALLKRALAFAEAHGYRGHEFGDAILILGDHRQAAAGEELGQAG
jgi:S-adenosylmethionine:tRNA ribosyltransferase-isomerase